MITHEELIDYLSYDEETGLFTVIKHKASRRPIGSIAGAMEPDGYIRISIDKKAYPAHRLAWLYMTGDFPSDCIDHINHIRNDNRWCNLREATHKINARNARKSKRNKSGVVGVSWSKSSKRWKAAISIDSGRLELGTFAKFSDAVDARKNAEVLYGYHENHGININ